MYVVQHDFSLIHVNIMAADGVAPVWFQGICNHVPQSVLWKDSHPTKQGFF